MNNSDEYNGWTNRETWAASLHLDNDENTYTMAREWAGEIATGTALAHARVRLADTLREFFEDRASAVTHDPGNAVEWDRMMVADVGSLWRVDWYEIADGIYDEYPAGELV